MSIDLLRADEVGQRIWSDTCTGREEGATRVGVKRSEALGVLGVCVRGGGSQHLMSDDHETWTSREESVFA